MVVVDFIEDKLQGCGFRLLRYHFEYARGGLVVQLSEVSLKFLVNTVV